MGTVNSAFKKSDNMLSVTLSNTGFVKDGEHVGRVTRNTVSTENIIAEIIENNTGLDPFTIQHAANLLQQAMLKMIRQGKAINILELGTMYIGMKGIVRGDSPDVSDIPELVLRFTPSQLANDALANIVIDKIVFSDTAPQIDVITDLWTGTDNQCLTPGKTCRIKGDKLKLGGNNFSISFIPVDDNGEEISGGKSVALESNRLCKNTAGMLEFFIPEELESNKKYVISIKTSYNGSADSRKIPAITKSDPLLTNLITKKVPTTKV